MPTAAPTAAPPNFYDNLPNGGNAQAMPPKKPESDADEDLMKGATGVYRVLSKMAEVKKDLKPMIDKIKDDIKTLVVQGLKGDPSQLDAGKDKTAEPPPAAKPTTTDETHAA